MSAKQYGIPTPIQFDRLYAGPLDKHEVFDSYPEALTYAQGPISYPGQVIGVKKSGLKEDVYVINQDKSLSRLMIQRDDIRVVLYADKWTGEVPYEQTVAVPYLELTDNCIISLGESVTDPEVVREIVNAKIGDTIQEEGSIRFIARGDIPKVDIPVTITIASVVSAVEIPNNVNDNTNHTVVIAKKDEWKGSKPPYTQDLYVFGVRPDSNGTIGINPDSSYAQINKMAAATAGVVRYEQRNNYVTIAAMNSKPTRDLEVLVVWGDEIVVFENSDTLEDFNTSVDLVLKANEWTTHRPYRQTLRVEGLSEYHTGAIGLSDNCTPEEAEIGLNAGLELVEQGNGYIVVEATDIKPTVDLPIYLTYGSNITIVPSPEYVGEANRHVDSMAYASKWVKSVDGWEQEIDVEGITSNSIGTMSLRNGITEQQTYAAATARIKITKVYDNKVLLTATRIRPNVNIPLCFVFGRNVNVAKYLGITGKVALDTNYIVFDDSLIDSGLSTLQQLLEYLQRVKIFYDDVVDTVHDGSLYEEYIPEADSVWKYNMPLSARMGRYLFKRKINYDDIIDYVTSEDKLKPLSANMGRYLDERITDTKEELMNEIDELSIRNSIDHNSINNSINLINEDLDQTVIRIQKDKPIYQSEFGGENRSFNILWIKADNDTVVKKYTVKFASVEGTSNIPSEITQDITRPCSIPETVPTRNGYRFLYWTDGVNEIYKGTLYTKNEETTVTLTAVWEPNTYKITLNDQGAGTAGIGMIFYKYTEPVFYSNANLTSDSILTDLSEYLPKKSGFKFTGYWKNVDDTNPDNRYIDETGVFKIIQNSNNTLYNIIGDSTIYAGWEGDSYTVQFNDGDNPLPGHIETLTAPRGIAVTIPSDYIPASRVGYEFLGWSDVETYIDGNKLWKPGDQYSEDANIILYAVWKYIVYSIELKNDDTVASILYHRYNENIIYSDEECIEPIAVITPPEKEGLSFNGYFSGKDGLGKRYITSTGDFENSIYTLTTNITLYAYFGEIQYTLAFDLSEGTLPAGMTLDPLYGTYNEILTIPNITPEKTLVDEESGKLIPLKFIGWMDYLADESNNGKTLWQPGENYTITQNNTLFADWETIVEIKLMDGDTINSTIYNIFDTNEYYSDKKCTVRIDNISPPVNSEQTFIGYYTTLEGQDTEKQYIDANGVISDELYQDNKLQTEITLTAKWE